MIDKQSQNCYFNNEYPFSKYATANTWVKLAMLEKHVNIALSRALEMKSVQAFSIS